MRSSTSPILLILAVSLLAVPPSSALDYPLSCGKYGNCLLIGATVNLEFPAPDFSSRRATFEVTGPDGQTVHADFDLASLR
jgi:hypothetical protein